MSCRAERLGFLNLVVEPGKALFAALALAEKVCESAPPAVREALAKLNAEATGDESLSWKRTSGANARLLQTEDLMEGLGAFFEKRPPRWTGK